MTFYNQNDGTGTATYVDSNTLIVEANGRAALLLVESLIHGLLARSVIDVADAVEIVQTAIDVVEEGAHESGNKLAAVRTLDALGAISSSLSRDLQLEAGPVDAGETST